MARVSAPIWVRARNLIAAPDSKFVRVFRHRDFRLFWIGAFLSFVGSWIQNVGQGFLVYELTGSMEKLALISFCSMVPVTLLGPFAGSFVDRMNKRLLLVWTQVFFACTAVLVAVLVHYNKITLEILLIIALANGVVSCFEMPGRQSFVSAIVPKEDLPIAIPFQGMTFNLARVVGPAIGGILLQKYGAQACFIVNAISFSALVFAGLAIKADTRASKEVSGPIMDLIQEGFNYTWREPRLKMLFLLETAISLFGLFYLAQLPALAKDVLKLDKSGVGDVYTAVGVGAIAALILTSKTSDLPVKGILVRVAVTTMGISLMALSVVQNHILAFIILGILGMSGVVIFNTCNSLFQLIAPERLRGRVVSMHIWALNGVGPLGVYPFGWLAQHYNLSFALELAGGLVILIATWAWLHKVRLEAQ